MQVEAQSTDGPQPGERSDAQASSRSPVNSHAEDKDVTLSSDNVQEAGHSSAEKKHSGENSRLRKLMKRLNPTPLPELLFTSLVGIAVATIAGILSAWAFGVLSGGGVDATQQIYYQPWDASGTAGLSSDVHIYSRVWGYCWERSVTTNRSDAYRCISGNSLLDPCISSPYEGVFSSLVVCPYPALQSVTLISLTKPLPKASVEPNGSPFPWLIVLTDGDRCTAFSGASILTAGMTEDYQCSNGDLYGNVDRSGQLWKIFKLQKGSSEVIQASIAEAYF
jgi:hypothetical protein